jgi:hypothetical protein
MLKRRFVVVAVGVMIFVAGALVGRAQRQRPDFMIKITAPVGPMQAECQYGCRFQKTQFLDKGRSTDGVADTISQVCQGTAGTMCSYTLYGLKYGTGVSPSN